MAVARSVLLWRRTDTLCTSGFMDDVIFSHKPRLLARRRRPAEAQCTRSLRLGYKMCAIIPVAGQRTHGTTFRVTIPRWQHRLRSLRSMTALLKYVAKCANRTVHIFRWPLVACPYFKTLKNDDWNYCIVFRLLRRAPKSYVHRTTPKLR